jgi:hypothetical protein
MIFGCLIGLCKKQWMPVKTETDQNKNSDYAERNSYERAELSSGTLRTGCRRKSPLAKKIPDADAQMERRRENAHYKKRQIPGIPQIVIYGVVRRSDVR